MTRRRGLGKGLDALIPSEDGLASGILDVPAEAIRRNPRQPRQRFDPSELEELAASIRQHGILQPLIVSPEEGQAGYVLISGERRLEAARLAGLDRVPVLLRRATDQEHLELALVENLQRTDLNPLEAAEGYRQLHEDFGLSHQEIASQVGKSRVAVTNTLRLLKLSPEVRKALEAGEVSEGHARALLSLSSAPAQSAALQTIRSRGLSVRQTEELVQRLGGERRTAAHTRTRSPEEADLEARLRDQLGTRVRLHRGRQGGTLVIHFYSDEDLNALVDRLLEDGT
jgi:ParB family chromosome partitioning protein